jgi:hypothetical protein
LVYAGNGPADLAPTSSCRVSHVKTLEGKGHRCAKGSDEVQAAPQGAMDAAPASSLPHARCHVSRMAGRTRFHWRPLAVAQTARQGTTDAAPASSLLRARCHISRTAERSPLNCGLFAAAWTVRNEPEAAASAGSLYHACCRVVQTAIPPERSRWNLDFSL